MLSRLVNSSKTIMLRNSLTILALINFNEYSVGKSSFLKPVNQFNILWNIDIEYETLLNLSRACLLDEIFCNLADKKM